MRDDLRFSRPIKTAETLGEFAGDRHSFIHKRVLLTGETAGLSTANGRESFLASLRLLIRICSNVSVAVPAEFEDLRAETEQLAKTLCFAAAVEIVDKSDGKGFDAVLNIGETRECSLPMTTINSNGWLVRVTSTGTSIAGPSNQVNPIGALAAACLGVSEIFKRLVALKPERAEMLHEPGFSFYSYRRSADDYGPALPSGMKVDLLLLGAGAIGNGVAYLLGRLPLSGSCDVVDMQEYQAENLGTCLLIGPGDLGRSKAKFIAATLNARLMAEGFQMNLEKFRDKELSGGTSPRIILSAVDNIEARHEVQRMWPDLIVDGAIGEFLCQASRHPWEGDIACLMCLFREIGGEAAELRASRLTGLLETRIRNAEDIINATDIAAAPPEKRGTLKSNLGRKICSVIQEAVAQDISEEKQREGFRPSVPFVACLSACMMVTELVKNIAEADSVLEPRYQFDVLRGPALGDDFPQIRRRDCTCVARRKNIDIFRQNIQTPSTER